PFKSKPETAAYLPEAVRALKPLSSGPNLNLEQLKATGVDLAIGWNTAAFRRNQLAQLDRVHVPTLLVGVDRLEQYPATFRLLGRTLGVAERGEALAAYLEQADNRLLKATAKIPPRQRVRVYYAESMDGLTSQCGEAHRAEVIRLAGAVNALSCSDLPNYQAIPADIESSNVTLGVETLLKMDPDVIVTRFSETRDIIGKDPRWRRLRAVQKGAVHAMPNAPFNWFDRPPSYMRIMGAQWLAQLLYPEIIRLDLARQTREFYRLFFQVDLDDGQLNALLGPMTNRAVQP
ncbi:MAG: ABC transporter substrate-binding protein, partial [Desulfobulbus sp.]